MPTYRYEALDSQGNPQRGEIEADSQQAAMAKVTAEGFFPTAVREVRFDDAGREAQTGRDVKRIIGVALVVVLIALAVLGSLSRTDKASQRQAEPAETSDAPPATNNAP